MSAEESKQANGKAKAESTRDFTEQEEIVQTLHRIEASLQAMSTVPAVPLSHYRVLPQATKEAYEILEQGAALIHGTSTKYTLLGKLDTVEQTKMSHDLRQGCELIATACLVLHEKSTGSSLSLRKHVIQASRAIVASTTHLLEAYTHGEALASQQDLGAQKTGAVWQMCSAVLDRKVPMGNRNAMRRDLLTYTIECQETMDEFQEVIEQGPAMESDDEPKKKDIAATANGETEGDSWEAFLSGESQQYTTPKEMAVAQAALAILKISRGAIKLSLQACDAVGDPLKESAPSNDEKPSAAEQHARLEWMRLLHEECCAVGEGVTDLGTIMYPPLKLSDVSLQLSKQMSRVEKVLHHVCDATITVHEEEEESDRAVPLELHVDVSSMAGKLQSALQKRKEEVITALFAVGCTMEGDS